MKIIGNVSEFAIQYEITSAYPTECFGHIIFWLGKDQLGRWEFEVWINSCLNWFKDFDKHKSIRTFPNSHLLSKEELFYQLHEKFYDGASIENGDYLHFGKIREVFSLNETGDASFRDFVNIILIDEPQLNRQRFIYQHYESENVKKEFFISLNFYEQIVKEFCDKASLEWKNMIGSKEIS